MKRALPLGTGGEFGSGFTGDLGLFLLGSHQISLLRRCRLSLLDVWTPSACAGAVIWSLHLTRHLGPGKTQQDSQTMTLADGRVKSRRNQVNDCLKYSCAVFRNDKPKGSIWDDEWTNALLPNTLKCWVLSSRWVKYGQTQTQSVGLNSPRNDPTLGLNKPTFCDVTKKKH